MIETGRTTDEEIAELLVYSYFSKIYHQSFSEIDKLSKKRMNMLVMYDNLMNERKELELKTRNINGRYN
ncbi:hypothetical protein A2415_04495 [candidate division WWE3 bacterium RIFOXYC1_FULL_39_7]|uniref:Uncharacterized protein n=1 Tax=candidate division WWE3 bacterium RIFOXYC1_FULL_39_7 TaxID=1802643 RepID=A0A1F4WFV2_UNCKA|nr:MAG: hypothetical protein A2415_04495 [candidate division WWE3 bacterium RIFOXYC1_FULL_39_7]